jgi:transposase-like protein
MDELSLTVNRLLETGISRAQLSRELGLGSGAIITKWGTVKRAHTNKQFKAIKIMRGMLQIGGKESIEEINIEEGQPLYKDGEKIEYRIHDEQKPGEKREAKVITVTYNGEEITGTIAELARRFGQKPVTVYTRLRNDYTPEEAFGLVESKRIRTYRTKKSSDGRATINLTFAGKTQSIREWAEELNLKEPTIRGRLSRDWPVDKVLSTPSPSLT